MNDISLRLILSDLRGAGNVGSIMRTADACAVELIYACGYTSYPAVTADSRPPHVVSSNTKAIAKTALGAEHSVPIVHTSDTASAIFEAKRDGFKIIVIEQSENSLNLYHYHPHGRLAVVLGNEVEGVTKQLINCADQVLELPMIGKKESLNVSVAAAITMYQLKFGQPHA